MNDAAEYRDLKRKQAEKPTRTRRKKLKGVGKRSGGKFADLSSNNGAKTQAAFTHYAKDGANVIGIKATEGTHYVNPYFAEQVKMAHAAGLLVLPYHFAQPGEGSAAAQAEHFVATCKAAGLHMGKRRKHWFERDHLPGCLDYEIADPDGKDGAWIKTFQHVYVARTGHGYALRSPGSRGPELYGGSVVREHVSGRLRLLFWLAAYVSDPAPFWPRCIPKRFRLAWQFTDSAHLGLGKADGSHLYMTVAQLLRLAV